MESAFTTWELKKTKYGPVQEWKGSNECWQQNLHKRWKKFQEEKMYLFNVAKRGEWRFLDF